MKPKAYVGISENSSLFKRPLPVTIADAPQRAQPRSFPRVRGRRGDLLAWSGTGEGPARTSELQSKGGKWVDTDPRQCIIAEEGARDVRLSVGAHAFCASGLHRNAMRGSMTGPAAEPGIPELGQGTCKGDLYENQIRPD